MPLPPNPTIQTQQWWTTWHLIHKLGSPEEGAFLGFLSHRNLHPYALSPEQLDVRWGEFLTWWAASTAP